jgi:TetR/AcrR family transcriptional regulator
MKKQIVPARGKELLILDAAQQRFAAGGYGKSTMDEIAADVGMCKAALYYYFPTKESVYRAVVLREQQEFLRGADGILRAGTSAREKVLQYVRLRLELAERLMNLNPIDQYAWHDLHPIFSELFESFSHEEHRCLLRLFREGTAAKEFTIAKPKQRADLLLHVLQALRLRLIKVTKNSTRGTSGHREWREESLLFATILLDGIAAPTA